MCFDIGELKASGINIAIMFVYDTIDVLSGRLPTSRAESTGSYMETKHCGGVIEARVCFMHRENIARKVLRKAGQLDVEASEAHSSLAQIHEMPQYRSNHSENF